MRLRFRFQGVIMTEPDESPADAAVEAVEVEASDAAEPEAAVEE